MFESQKKTIYLHSTAGTTHGRWRWAFAATTRDALPRRHGKGAMELEGRIIGVPKGANGCAQTELLSITGKKKKRETKRW